MGEGVGDRSHVAGHGQVTDAALVQATRTGDLRAWEQLVRRHQEVVFRSAYLATRDPVSAEDVTKVAFVRAHHSLGSLKEGVAVRPWLVGITASVARSHLRELAQRRDAKVPIRESTPRLPATPQGFEPGVPWPTPAEHEILVGAFDGMGDEDRLILAARYSFGFSSTDAATRLGIEPDQVDERLRASAGRLRARIAQPPGAPGSRMADVSTTAGTAHRSDRLVTLSDRSTRLPDHGRGVLGAVVDTGRCPCRVSAPGAGGNSLSRATGLACRGRERTIEQGRPVARRIGAASRPDVPG